MGDIHTSELPTFSKATSAQKTIIKFLHTLKKEEQFPELENLLQKDFSNLINEQALVTQMNDLEWTMCLNIALYLSTAFKEMHEVVEALLAWQQNRSFRADTLGQLPIHFAIMGGVTQLLKKICEIQPTQIAHANSEGNTPLHYAVSQSCPLNIKISLVEILLQTASSQALNIIDKKNANQDGALHLAVQLENFQLIKLFLKNKASLKLNNKHGKTPMHIAAQKGNQDIAILLLTYGGDIQIKDNKGRTPLHPAAKEGNLVFVKWALENGAVLGEQDAQGKTALEIVHTWYTSKDIGHVLRERLKSVMFFLGLQHAASKVDEDDVLKNVMPFLDLKQSMAIKQLQLCTAIQQGALKRVKNCLKNQPLEINTEDEDGMTPLHLAAQKGNQAIAALLLTYGANLQVTDHKNNTPLHLAIKEGHVDFTKWALEKGALVDTEDEDGMTPLYIAAQKGNQAIAALLLEHGGDINTRDDLGNTLLHFSVKEGHVDFTKWVLKKGALVNATNHHSMTSLHLAAQKDNQGIAALLLEYGGEINVKDYVGYTPLHFAVEEGHLDFAHYALQQRIEVDAEDEDGMTPLHCAVKKKDVKIVQLLCAYGADIQAENHQGQTPLDIAKSQGIFEVATLLSQLLDESDEHDDEGITLPLKAVHLRDSSQKIEITSKESGSGYLFNRR